MDEWDSVISEYSLQYTFDPDQVETYCSLESGSHRLEMNTCLDQLKRRLEFLEMAYGTLPDGNMRDMIYSHGVIRAFREHFIILWDPRKYRFFGLLHQLQEDDREKLDPDLKAALIEAISRLPGGISALEENGYRPHDVA